MINKKSKIIIGSSYNKKINTNFSELIENNIFTGIPHFFIKENGRIINLINIDQVSRFTNTIHDYYSITIMLENSGFLNYNFFDEQYYDVFNCIYNKKNITEKIWRNKRYWVNYSNKQLISLKNICIELCKVHNITPTVVENNIKSKENLNKNIISRSNISPMYLDLNPSFDFGILKEIVYELQ